MQLTRPSLRQFGLLSSLTLIPLVSVITLIVPRSAFLAAEPVAPVIIEPTSVLKHLTWTPTLSDTGTYKITLVATDSEGNTEKKNVTVVVTDPASEKPEEDQGSDDSQKGDGDSSADGGGGGGPDPEPPPRPSRTFTLQPETGHRILGTYSGVVRDGGTTGVRLAGNRDRLERSISVPTDTYTVLAKLRADRPAPVNFALYIGQKAWKVFSLKEGDNRYHTYCLGQLRNFSGGIIGFRLINDTYDRANPTNEELDRNLFVAQYQLTSAQPSDNPCHEPTVGQVRGTTTSQSTNPGWRLLPGLNQTMRVHGIPITFTNWQYYAQRLTAPPNKRGAITNQAELSSVMRYWRAQGQYRGAPL